MSEIKSPVWWHNHITPYICKVKNLPPSLVISASEDTSAEEKEAAGRLLSFPSSGSYCSHSAGWFQAPSVFYPGEDSDLGDRVF